MTLLVPSFLIHALAPVLQSFLQALRQWTKPNRTSLARGAVTDFIRSKSDLIVENALLRQQLIVLERQVKGPKLTWRERGIMVLLSSWLKAWQEALPSCSRTPSNAGTAISIASCGG